MSDKERAAAYRYADQIKGAAEKLLKLVENPPYKYQNSFRLMPGRVEAAETIVAAAAALWNSDWRIIDVEGAIAAAIMLPDSEFPRDPSGNLTADASAELDLYERYTALNQRPAKSGGLKMTRNAFCERVLNARLANPRWGWVGVKESETEDPGALFIFAWEHNKRRNGEGTVGFFHRDVSVDENTGRRRPGHRDALEKIGRAVSGELETFVVWQTAVDAAATPKSIESINGEYVTRCDLYLDEAGYWTGALREDISLSQETN